jgi:penicillin-binding protein 1A
VGYPDKLIPMETEFAGEPVTGGTFPALIWRDFQLTATETYDERNAQERRRKGLPPQEPRTVTTPPAVPSAPDGTPSAPAPAPAPEAGAGAGPTGGAAPGGATAPGGPTGGGGGEPGAAGGAGGQEAAPAPAAPATPEPAPSPPPAAPPPAAPPPAAPAPTGAAPPAG